MTDLIPGEYDVKLNGLRIHYTIRGSGPALIAHFGGPGLDARLWGDFAGIDEFSTVIAIHPRGSGLSDPSPDDAYFLRNYVLDVEALRVHLDLEKPILLGWSHGGFVAQQFAFTYPHSLSKLILLESAAYIGEFLGDIEAAVSHYRSEPWFEKSFSALEDSFTGKYETDEEKTQLLSHSLKFYFRRFDDRAKVFIDRFKEYLVTVKPAKVFHREAATMDLRPKLRDITVSTLVLVGRHDFITNVAMAEEMTKHIPNARLEIFEDSGHFVPIEEQEKYYRLVKQFVLGT